MSYAMRWLEDSEEELDQVAQTRMRCYAHAPGELAHYRKGVTCQGRAKAGDYLIAQRDGRPVGTATSLDMVMWLRGAPFPCQGIAYVGAIKTERRKGRVRTADRVAGDRGESFLGKPVRGADPTGVASAVMWETIRRARERECVLSSLSPWRATFYEHFGYGLVERRLEWTLPLTLLPSENCDGIRFLQIDRDRAALEACHQRIVEAGQCDLERPTRRWDHHFATSLAETDFCVVDRPDENGPIHGWLSWEHMPVNGQDLLKVWFMACDSPAALLRQLAFLSSLRDQYSAVMLSAPADFPLNRLLREPQLPHRSVTHTTAECRLVTRLQNRVLDHRRLVEGLSFPAETKGAAVIAIHETEGDLSRFQLEVASGRASARPTNASADIELSDRTWASIACGDLPATSAARLGLIDARQERMIPLLDAFSGGPAPFCRDYF